MPGAAASDAGAAGQGAVDTARAGGGTQASSVDAPAGLATSVAAAALLDDCVLAPFSPVEVSEGTTVGVWQRT